MGAYNWLSLLTGTTAPPNQPLFMKSFFALFTAISLVCLTAGSSLAQFSLSQTRTLNAVGSGGSATFTFDEFGLDVDQIVDLITVEVTLTVQGAPNGGNVSFDNDGTSAIVDAGPRNYIITAILTPVAVGGFPNVNAQGATTYSLNMTANDGDNTATFDLGTPAAGDDDFQAFGIFTNPTTDTASGTVNSAFFDDYTYDIATEMMGTFDIGFLSSIVDNFPSIQRQIVNPIIDYEVTITVSGIPEPNSIGLVGMLALGFIAARRRARSRD